MRVKDLTGKSAEQLENMARAMTYTEQRETWKYMRKILKSRFKTFMSHGLKGAIPTRFRSGVPTIRQIGGSEESHEELTKELVRAFKYLPQSYATARGYEESALGGIVQQTADRLGISMNAKQYSEYKSFMDEMSARYGNAWQRGSGEAEEMYLQSRRLGISIDQFKKNFDYWKENIQYLKKATPRKGRKTPSAYIKELKMENISSWKRRKR